MNKSAQKLLGFTLIELLIVIAVIGILATAVLSAINPVEQIKKGRDTAKRSDAAELLNAVERYYVTFEKGPWEAIPSASSMSSSDLGIIELIAKGELKTQFKDRRYLSSLVVSESTSTGLTFVCFAPQSVTFQAKANKTNAGGTCTSGTGSGCFMCLPE